MKKGLTLLLSIVLFGCSGSKIDEVKQVYANLKQALFDPKELEETSIEKVEIRGIRATVHLVSPKSPITQQLTFIYELSGDRNKSPTWKLDLTIK